MSKTIQEIINPIKQDINKLVKDNQDLGERIIMYHKMIRVAEKHFIRNHKEIEELENIIKILNNKKDC